MTFHMKRYTFREAYGNTANHFEKYMIFLSGEAFYISSFSSCS